MSAHPQAIPQLVNGYQALCKLQRDAASYDREKLDLLLRLRASYSFERAFARAQNGMATLKQRKEKAKKTLRGAFSRLRDEQRGPSASVDSALPAAGRTRPLATIEASTAATARSGRGTHEMERVLGSDGMLRVSAGAHGVVQGPYYSHAAAC